jgi:hypothetical protein
MDWVLAGYQGLKPLAINVRPSGEYLPPGDADAVPISCDRGTPRTQSMSLEVLDFAFVFFGGGAGVEGAEVAAPTRLRILLARVEAVFS